MGNYRLSLKKTNNQSESILVRIPILLHKYFENNQMIDRFSENNKVILI